MANSYIKGMIQGGDPIISQVGFVKPQQESARNKARPVSNNRSTNNDDTDINGLLRQETEYRLVDAEFQGKKNSAKSQIYNIIRNKYHGDVGASMGDEDVNMILTQLRRDKAMIVSAKNTIEQNKVNFEGEYEDARSKNSLQDYAVDERGRRLYVGNDGELTSEGRGGAPQGDYLLVGEYYRYQEKNMGLNKDNNGRLIPDQLVKINHLDNKVDYVSNEAAKWMPKSGYTKEGTAVMGVQGAYDAINRNSIKSNRKQLEAMAGALSSQMGPQLEQAMKQRYWKSGWDRSALYHVKQRDGEGNVLTTKVKGKDGKIVSMPLYTERFIEREDISAAEALSEGQRSDYQKEIVATSELNDATKFSIFSAMEFKKYVDPMSIEDENQGLGVRKSGGSSGSGDNEGDLIHANIEHSAASILSSKQAAQGPPDRKTTIFRKQTPLVISGNEIQEKGIFKKEDFNSYSLRLDDKKSAELAEENAKRMAPFMNEAGQLTGMPKNYELEKITNAVNINGTIISGDLLKGAYLYSLNNEFATLPKLGVNSESGEYDWAAGNQSQVWKSATMLISKEDFERISNGLVGEADVRSEDGMIAGNLPDIEYKGGFDHDRMGLGFNPTKMAKDYGITEMPTSSWFGNDMMLVKMWIPPTETVPLEYTDKPSKANAQVVEKYWNDVAQDSVESIDEYILQNYI